VTPEQVVALLTLIADLQRAVTHLSAENASLRDQIPEPASKG
jgi:hypothetical protein